MKKDFDVSGKRRHHPSRQGEIVPADSFSALLVDRSVGYVYVSGDMTPSQLVLLKGANLFVDGGFGTGTSIQANMMDKAKPLSVLGVRTIKAGASPGVSLLLFEKTAIGNPEITRTLRAIDHSTLLVCTTDARALFDACMMHISESVPGNRPFRKAAEDLVAQARQTLADLGEDIRVGLINDNLHSVHYSYNKDAYTSAKDFLNPPLRLASVGIHPRDALTPAPENG